MALYFDGTHLVSDTSLEELHSFAVGNLCLKKSWFQSSPPASFPHYDVFGYKVRLIKSKFSDIVIITQDKKEFINATFRFMRMRTNIGHFKPRKYIPDDY